MYQLASLSFSSMPPCINQLDASYQLDVSARCPILQLMSIDQLDASIVQLNTSIVQLDASPLQFMADPPTL